MPEDETGEEEHGNYNCILSGDLSGFIPILIVEVKHPDVVFFYVPGIRAIIEIHGTTIDWKIHPNTNSQ